MKPWDYSEGSQHWIRGDDLCAPFVRELPVSGVSIAIFDPSGNQSSVCSSDETAARIDELQFELGEGPQWETVRTGANVLIPAVGAGSHERWPVFGTALHELGVGALFTLPLFVGRECVGAVSLYRTSSGELPGADLASATVLADSVAGAALGRAMASASDGGSPESRSAPAIRREVHQATGMVLAQLNTTAPIAYARLQAHAFANDQTLQDVARDVVSRQLSFRPLPE